ncbi:hypothetical protein ACJMK2_036306 [Sinanodonta woodiana]|uniref:Uncharacterized protein n=1 Tax=Sinanodonta woodiana TaxID=1069815 RepID=A0ABD3WGT0_SINWO
MVGPFGAGALPLISCIALLAGATLIILGFGAPYWAHNKQDYVGLWRFGNCEPAYKNCYYYDQPSPMQIPDWLHAVRAMESLAIIFIAIPLVTLPIYMYIALGMYYRCFIATMSVSSLLSAICGIVGVIVYGAEATKLDWTISWSLIVVVIGSACAFIGFLVLLAAMCAKRPESIKQAYLPKNLYIHESKPKLYTIQVDNQ